MRLLLEHGANPKLTPEDGTTAVMAAAGVCIWAPGENPGTEEEALAAVRLVYEAGGGLATDVDKNGETALHGAIYRAGPGSSSLTVSSTRPTSSSATRKRRRSCVR